MFRKQESRIPEDQKQAIFMRIRPFIAKQLNIEAANVELASKVVEDLGADSLDTIELTMALEEEFNIEILDENAEKMETVEDIVVYLIERGIQ